MRTSNNYIGKLIGADMDVTTDQPIKISGDSSLIYIIRRIIVVNPSISLTTAAGGFYTAASKGGTTVVAASQAYTALTGSTKWVDLTLASGVTGDTLTAGTLYFSLTTAQGAAATADIYIFGDLLN